MAAHKRLLLFALPLTIAACAGPIGSPTAPTQTGVTGSITVVSGTTVLRAGQTDQASATVMLADGALRAVATGFTSDNPAVATVSDRGLITGVANGEASISVTSNGGRGSRTIRVVPDYQGSWRGTYQVTGCSDSGALNVASGCKSFIVGAHLDLAGSVTQTGEMVNIRATVGSLTANLVTIPVTADGSVRFNTVVTVPNIARVELAMTLNSTSPGTLTGTLTQTWTALAFPGSMLVTGTFDRGGIARLSTQ